MTRMSDGASGPRKRPQRHSNEEVDEPGKLIDHEPAEIERAVPADATEPVERRPDERQSEPPVFEE